MEIRLSCGAAPTTLTLLHCMCLSSLPENVLWFEPPTVVGWDEEKGFWTGEDYHDIKFNEEKQVGALLQALLGRTHPDPCSTMLLLLRPLCAHRHGHFRLAGRGGAGRLRLCSTVRCRIKIKCYRTGSPRDLPRTRNEARWAVRVTSGRHEHRV